MNEQQIQLIFALIQGVIGLVRRHQQGENVTKDLDELAEKANALYDKEVAIANTPVEPILPFDYRAEIPDDPKPLTTEELIEAMKKDENTSSDNQ